MWPSAAALLLALALLLVGQARAYGEKHMLNTHRVEIRVADPDTQCDNNPDWLVDMGTPPPALAATARLTPAGSTLAAQPDQGPDS